MTLLELLSEHNIELYSFEAIEILKINSIIDANLYGMPPSPTFRVPPHSSGTPGFPGTPTQNVQQRLRQPFHSF
ncbi:hypothetical protein BGX26_005789, partial [Mortierella sp. AD094]